MSTPRIGIVTVLPLLNVLAWALFLILRAPIPAGELHARDMEEARDRQRSGMSMDVFPGAPYGILASRYLYNWDEWHGGGENPWLKCLMVLNLPPLIATAVVSLISNALVRGAVPIAVRSWFYFVVLLALSSLFWYSIGALVRVVWAQFQNRHGAGPVGAA